MLFQLFSLLLFAQQREISGIVTNDSGDLLPGVNIIIKGTSIGTTTDFNGNYQITIAEEAGAILVFSYLGLETQEIPIGTSNVINVILAETGNLLDEVVITALGIERETKSLVYARQAMNTEGIEEARSTNILNSLAGKVAGVQFIGADTPTGSPRVVIRGITSVTGNNAPLYVIDGIPMDQTQGDQDISVWNGGDDLDYGNPISDISPDDIASIEVLKGANAGALYGSRASNGVILITTKRGKSRDGLGISINSNVSMTSITQYPDYQYVYGAGSSMRMVQNASHIDPATGFPRNARHRRAYGAPLLGFDVLSYNNEVGEYLARPDNIEGLYQDGYTFTNNVAIDKAYEGGSFRISYTNTQSDYTVPGFEVQNRNNLSLNVSQDIGKSLVVNSSILYTNDKVKNRLYQNGSNRNPANNYLYMAPDMWTGNLLPYKDENGNAFSYGGPFQNPYWNLYENSNKDERNVLRGFVGLTWNINEEFSLSGKVMGDMFSYWGDEFNNMGSAFDIDGYYRTNDNNTSNWNFETMLNYKKDINKFAILATVGANRFDFNQSGRTIRISSLLVPDVLSVANSNAVPEVRERDGAKRVNSIFGSLSVGYNELIYLDVTGRNDWSSTLPLDNNSYFYPSVGTSFIFSELLEEGDAFRYGKLRVSWASVGSDTSPYNILTTYGYGGNYNGTSWLALDDTRKNPFLKPELTSSMEYGLDLGFLQNRLTVNLTYYDSTTNNQIIEAQVTPTTGFDRQVYNAGKISNKGFEVFLQGKALTGEFKWDIDLNWSTNESLVEELIGDVTQLQLRTWFNVNVVAEVGKPFGEIIGNMRARDPESGVPLVGNNGRILHNLNQRLGNAQPDWIAGLRNSFRYKGFSLSFLLDVKQGGDLYSGTMLKSWNFGMHSATLMGSGRDAYYFSSIVLGENNNERRGDGLFGNDYNDSERPKGVQYENAAIGVRDADGNWVAQRDAEGNIVFSENWINPQQMNYDPINDQERVTYDTSYIKLREAVLGYTIPKKSMGKLPFQSARVSVVGRNLWTIKKNTPDGLDPEAGTTSGNGQGIEYGTFLPTRTVGLNVKLSF